MLNIPLGTKSPLVENHFFKETLEVSESSPDFHGLIQDYLAILEPLCFYIIIELTYQLLFKNLLGF